jgi:hypothetical protein
MAEGIRDASSRRVNFETCAALRTMEQNRMQEKLPFLYSCASRLEIVHVWLPPCIKGLKGKVWRSMKIHVAAPNTKFRLGILFLAKSSPVFYSNLLLWEAIKEPARWREPFRSNTQRKGAVLCIPEQPELRAKQHPEPHARGTTSAFIQVYPLRIMEHFRTLYGPNTGRFWDRNLE